MTSGRADERRKEVNAYRAFQYIILEGRNNQAWSQSIESVQRVLCVLQDVVTGGDDTEQGIRSDIIGSGRALRLRRRVFEKVSGWATLHYSH